MNAAPDPEAGVIRADFYDGRRAVATPVRLHFDAQGRLRIEGEGVSRTVDPAGLAWPEPQRHGPRLLHLPDGAQVHCPDGLAWDRWSRDHGARPGLVVRMQQSWRATLLAVLLLAVSGWAIHAFGVPLIARAVLAFVPASVDARVGEETLEALDRTWLGPSGLPEATRRRIQARFGSVLAEHATRLGEPLPPWSLVLRRSRDDGPGPNAFALPGGTIVLTDEMVALLDDRDDALMGVLAHEFGHVRHRHGMRQLVQTGLLGVVVGLVMGDPLSVLGTAPLVIGQMAYSREFERESDEEAIAAMRAAGLRPDALVVLFERLAESQPERAVLPIALASHPGDAQRIARLRAATAGDPP